MLLNRCINHIISYKVSASIAMVREDRWGGSQRQHHQQHTCCSNKNKQIFVYHDRSLLSTEHSVSINITLCFEGFPYILLVTSFHSKTKTAEEKNRSAVWQSAMPKRGAD